MEGPERSSQLNPYEFVSGLLVGSRVRVIDVPQALVTIEKELQLISVHIERRPTPGVAIHEIYSLEPRSIPKYVVKVDLGTAVMGRVSFERQFPQAPKPPDEMEGILVGSHTEREEFLRPRPDPPIPDPETHDFIHYSGERLVKFLNKAIKVEEQNKRGKLGRIFSRFREE